MALAPNKSPIIAKLANAVFIRSSCRRTCSSHGEPCVKEERVVVVCVDPVSVEFVVIDVLSPDAGIEPRPQGGLAHPERHIGELKHIAVAVRNARTQAAGEEERIETAPRREILSGGYDPVVGAIGKRSLGRKGVQLIVQIGCIPQKQARIESLAFMDVAASRRKPVVAALVLILRVETDI